MTFRQTGRDLRGKLSEGFWLRMIMLSWKLLLHVAQAEYEFLMEQFNQECSMTLEVHPEQRQN